MREETSNKFAKPTIISTFSSYSASLLISFAFLACGGEEVDSENPITRPMNASQLDILAIGDSALSWNQENSTPKQLGKILTDRGLSNQVINRSVGGATLGCGENGVGTADNCIPPQYETGDWDYILLSGGGNDILESACALGADVLMDSSLTSGLMLDFINQRTAQGGHILLYGYFLPLDPNGEEARCAPIFELLSRYQALGNARTDVTYIDAGRVVKRTSPEYYADDIHPSSAGSRVIAELIANTIVP